MSFKIYTPDKILSVVKLIKSWEEHVASKDLGDVHAGFWWENLRERDHLKYEGIDVRTIIQSIFKKQNRTNDWIDLAQNRDRWRVLVNAVIKIRVS
jgi:hypothetical protein